MDDLHRSIIKITKQEMCNSMCRLLGKYEKTINNFNNEMEDAERMGLKLAALNFHKKSFDDYIDGFLKEHNGADKGVHEHYHNLTRLNIGAPKL